MYRDVTHRQHQIFQPRQGHWTYLFATRNETSRPHGDNLFACN